MFRFNGLNELLQRVTQPSTAAAATKAAQNAAHKSSSASSPSCCPCVCVRPPLHQLVTQPSTATATATATAAASAGDVLSPPRWLSRAQVGLAAQFVMQTLLKSISSISFQQGLKVVTRTQGPSLSWPTEPRRPHSPSHCSAAEKQSGSAAAAATSRDYEQQGAQEQSLEQGAVLTRWCTAC